MKKLTTVLLALSSLLASSTFAGDIASVRMIGFSVDGTYAAFEQYGVRDGSGASFSEIYFLNTVKNTYAAKPISAVIESETTVELPAARKKAMKKAAATLAKLHISSEIQAVELVSRSLYDVGARDAKIQFSTNPFFPGDENSLGSVDLVETEVDAKCMEENAPNCGAKLKITLNVKDGEGKGSAVLQDDVTLPAARVYARNYTVDKVLMMQPDQSSGLAAKYVVLVRYETAGFEGPDTRYVAVTGARFNLK